MPERLQVNLAGAVLYDKTNGVGIPLTGRQRFHAFQPAILAPEMELELWGHLRRLNRHEYYRR
jgi:hypothetical protein